MFSLGRSRKTSSHSRNESGQLSAYPRSPSLPSTTTPSPRSSNGFSYSPTLPSAQASTPQPPRTDSLSVSDDLIEMAPTRSFASSSSASHNSHSLYPSHSPQPQPSPPPDHQHPYGSLMSASVRDNEEDEEVCPVCLCELSLRLQGERPHVVPVCGHRLHHDCFEAVYGDVNRARIKTSSLGLCGVCRRDMKLGDGGDGPGKKNKFAALSGLPQPAESSTHKMRSVTKGTLDEDQARHDPTEDDELIQLPPPGSLLTAHYGARESTSTGSTGSTITGRRSSAGTIQGSTGGGSSRGSHGGASSFDIVKPIITVRAEHGHVERSNDKEKKQHVTCMVTIEMPSRWPTPMPFLEGASSMLDDRGGPDSYGRRQQPPLSVKTTSEYNTGRPSSPTPSSVYSAYAYGSTSSPSDAHAANPFASVVEDLQLRMADWKGHSPDEFGALKLYDYINVRKDTNTREFLVYLFEEAILCVTDDKRKGIAGKIADGLSGDRDKLRLKGRVYVRHIRTVIDTSKGSDLSLTIMMSDDALDEFVMTFKERSSLEIWRAQIDHLVAVHSNPSPTYSATSAPSTSPHSRAMATSKSNDSVAGSDYSGASSGTHLSGFSGYTRTTSSTAPLSSSVIHEEEASDYSRGHGKYSSGPESPYGLPSPASRYAPNPFGPRDFTPLDLMLILSVPPSSGPNSLKLGIIKSSLDFILQNVGPRTRISIVTFSSGEGPRGVLRKTPFIAVGKAEGRKRLEAVVGELGAEQGDCSSLIEHKEERVNVVTACNLALDIVLQRKAKSALTGMVLMNDGRDGAQKQQMDLVMARAEAANVPIHTLGWGKFHDPSSLWLLSNHTGGSYIFVKDFHDLRDALAGCIGGILSIAATNTRLHISVPERRWFRIRKVSGTPGAIVSTAGSDVDIDIGELRFGERKDLLVEVEMGFAGYGDNSGQKDRHHDQPAFSTATDAFFLSKGLSAASLDDYSPSNLYDDEYDSMPDEVPLFEVNAAYRDPAAGKTISRLNHSPCLLTITVIPASGSNRTTPSTSAPEIVRRRMELLSSDMLSRALLLMTRRNDSQAKRLLEETKRIISTIAVSLNTSPSPPSGSLHPPRSSSRRGSVANTLAQRTLEACAEDVGKVLEGCIHRDEFDTHVRYSAAQQAVVLRDQRSWTPKSAIERLFWTADNSLWMVARSQQWLDSR